MSDSETGDGGSKAAPKRGNNRRARPPVTIDLAAETAPSEAPAGAEPIAAAEPTESAPPDSDPEPVSSAPEPSPPPPPPLGARPVSPFPPRVERPKTDWSSAGRLIAAGVFGGALATVLGILYHASGIIPTRAEVVAADAVRQASEVAEKVAAFDARLATVEAAAATLPALAEKIASLEKLEDTNRSRIENLENAMPVVGNGPDGTVIVGPLEDRIEKAETTLIALGKRLDDVSARLDELAARPPPAVESERAARAIAIGLLRQGADSGEGFAADLAMLKALGMDGDDVAALEQLARNGAPTIPALQAAFPSVADAILAATSAIGPDAGIFDRVAAFGRGLVTIRPTVPIEGDTPEAVVSRMQAAVNRADLAAALDERAKLPPEGQAASATWAESAGDRVAIDTIVERLVLSVTPPAN